MTTFSQLVDSVAKELVRPDMVAVMAGYLNASLRDVHFRANGDTPAYFSGNRQEDELTVTADGVYLWDLPSVQTFQKVETIYSQSRGIYFPPKTPATAYRFSDQPFARFYHYRAGPRVCIANTVSGEKLAISWFEYPRRLPYLAENARTVIWDPEEGSYVPGPAANGDEDAMNLTGETNWLLERWGVEVLADGIKQKAWARLGETERARMAYSTFQRGINRIWQSEGIL